MSCARVRLKVGADWDNHPGLLAGEVAVICKTCSEERAGLATRDYFKGVRQTVRRQTHKEPWAPGTTPGDVWKGFREGDR